MVKNPFGGLKHLQMRFAKRAILLYVLALGAPLARGDDWRPALPGWDYEFPRDHAVHREFKTEWWYFTGNLRGSDGRRLGYQLTFFRQGVRIPGSNPPQTRFAVDDLKFAHFAISELGPGRFHHAQKSSRGAFGEAGFAEGDKLAWIEDWTLRLGSDGVFRLQAKMDGAAIALTLKPLKPPIVHGATGVSQKSAGEGQASHYVSYTRMETTGVVSIADQRIDVVGESWFDHEWASNQLGKDQIGWDWFSAQFDDGSELMLFQIRLRDGSAEPLSHGTFVDAQGEATPLSREDFRVTPGKLWKSPESGASYPVEWDISVPKFALTLRLTTLLEKQELNLSPVSYWEGAVDYDGTAGSRRIKGHGYLEMTGYAGPLVGLGSPSTP